MADAFAAAAAAADDDGTRHANAADVAKHREGKVCPCVSAGPH